MRSVLIGVAAAALGAALPWISGGSWQARAATQQAGSRVCLHNQDETPEERERRVAALRLARAINTAQSVAWPQSGRYAPLESLANLPAPPDGFEAALSTDGRSYIFSVKDRLDPCRFAYFSDQNGLIYVGAPLQ